MVATYDPNTDIGKVRLYTGIETDVTTALLEDEEIQVLIDTEGDLKLAAAMACDLIANSEAFVLKVISLLDLRTDGPAVARALRDHATALRKQYDESGGWPGFEIAEEPDTTFGYRILRGKNWLRNRVELTE
jgi:hypothetical protein